jgi:hypothetical protein
MLPAAVMYCCTAAAEDLLARHTQQLYSHLKQNPAFALQQQQPAAAVQAGAAAAAGGAGRAGVR